MNRKIPSAITNIKLNRATFTDEPVEGLTFINFFYGNNGVGKSSVANAIKEDDGVTWADGCSAADYDVLVYDQDFIDRNFAAYDNLKGVFTVSEVNVKIRQEVGLKKAAKAKLSDERAAVLKEYSEKAAARASLLTAFQTECWTKTADIRAAFDKALSGKKQKRSFAEAILGEKSPAPHDPDELKKLYDVAFDGSAGIYREFKKVSLSATYASLPGKELLDRMIISSSDRPFAKFMKAIRATDWVRQGHIHFSGLADGRCPYCQRVLPENFEEELASCFDAQYQQDIRDLGQFRDTYERETTEIVRALRENLNDVMPSLNLEEYLSRVELLEKNFIINLQRITEKVQEPTKVVSLEDTDILLVETGSLIDDINRQIRANNNVVNRKKASVAKCKKEILQYLAFLLRDVIGKYYEDDSRLDGELTALITRRQQLQEDMYTLTAEIDGLNSRAVSTEAAVNSINKILKESGFQGFSLRLKEGMENTYEVIRNNGSAAENLSEGERNFIAFLYFYHQVRGSRSSGEAREKIVVIDDPVSGMDSTALFFVSAIVREMITICRNHTEYGDPKISGDFIRQIFVLTHNVHFYREVTCKQVGYYSCVSFYVIRKTDNASAVKLCRRRSESEPAEQENYNPVQNSYAALWEELREIRSTIPALNIMRRILEYYFVQLCGYDGSSLRELVLDKKENREKFIRQTEEGRPDMTDCRLAATLLAYISNPQGIGNEVDYVEDCYDADAYKRVFKRIFEVLGQKQHFDMMAAEG